MILKAVLIFALLFLFMMMGAPMAIALGASTVITLVTTVASIFGLCLRDAHQFEFGSSRGSRDKDVLLSLPPAAPASGSGPAT